MVTFNHPHINGLEIKSLLQQELFKRGILWSGFHTLSFSHSITDVEYTLKAYKDALIIVKEAVQENNIKKYLKGLPVEPVFRKTSNFNTKPKN
jgi:glutamate-1-semialdehyde 2,1-aminomutase/spore coat polysaccharide biosynthesis protein SpsF